MNRNYLSREDLIEKCPPLVQSTPSRTLSSKYVTIPSIQVVDDVMDLGWKPVSGHMRGSGKSRFCKHAVTFEHPDLQVSLNNDTVNPQITFTNSYDGLSAFKFYAGLFRLICSNGLVLPIRLGNKELGQSIRIPHINYDLSQLSTTLKSLVYSMKSNVEHASFLMDREMSDSEKAKFTKHAYLDRMSVKPEEVKEMLASIPDETLDVLLKPTRLEDQGDNAWVVFNRVQEKVINGFTAPAFNDQTKIQKYKPIRSFERKFKLNSNLYSNLTAVLN